MERKRFFEFQVHVCLVNGDTGVRGEERHLDSESGTEVLDGQEMPLRGYEAQSRKD